MVGRIYNPSVFCMDAGCHGRAVKRTKIKFWWLSHRSAIASVPLGRCLGALDPVEIYIGCPLPRIKCLGALVLSKLKHTRLVSLSKMLDFIWFFLPKGIINGCLRGYRFP